jgi:hypothetical protein
VVVEVDEGRHVASAPLRFDELLDRWLDVKRRTVEPSTLVSYERIARTYARTRCANGSRRCDRWTSTRSTPTCTDEGCLPGRRGSATR